MKFSMSLLKFKMVSVLAMNLVGFTAFGNDGTYFDKLMKAYNSRISKKYNLLTKDPDAQECLKTAEEAILKKFQEENPKVSLEHMDCRLRATTSDSSERHNGPRPNARTYKTTSGEMTCILKDVNLFPGLASTGYFYKLDIEEGPGPELGKGRKTTNHCKGFPGTYKVDSTIVDNIRKFPSATGRATEVPVGRSRQAAPPAVSGSQQ